MPSSGLLWYTFTAKPSSGFLWHIQHRHPDYYGTHSKHTTIQIIMVHSNGTPSSGLLIIMAHIHIMPSSGLLWHTFTAHHYPDYYGTHSQHAVIRIFMAHIQHRHPDYYGTHSKHTTIQIIMVQSHGTPSSGL